MCWSQNDAWNQLDSLIGLLFSACFALRLSFRLDTDSAAADGVTTSRDALADRGPSRHVLACCVLLLCVRQLGTLALYHKLGPLILIIFQTLRHDVLPFALMFCLVRHARAPPAWDDAVREMGS